MTEQWRSRIVRHGEASPGELLSNPFNFRIHPQVQQQAIEGALDEIGWITAVIVNERTGHVIDGHARIAIAITRGEASVPVVYVDLDENEERIALATINPLAEMAYTDQRMIDDLLADTEVDNVALRSMLTGMASPPMSDWSGAHNPTQEQIDDRGEEMADHFKDLVGSRTLVPLTCPHCGSGFSVREHDIYTG